MNAALRQQEMESESPRDLHRKRARSSGKSLQDRGKADAIGVAII
jgi:hypothetical protein